MYREFFGLKLKPFSITPDPRFLYMSPGHKEALAHLLYGIKEASGFVVITGEVGTGKTTILNAFLLKLPPRMPKVVIKNPHIKVENLYFLLGEAISMPEGKRSRDYIHEYEERLKETGGAVLIVDESQGLSIEMLEEIRLLSNLETTNEKLVQIMLLGQQELNDKLKSPHLRQLKQRIGLKYHIPPLDSNETRDYIDHRLRVAGYEPMEKPIFTVSALSEIYRYSKGFPRLINIVCDNVLLGAFTENTRQVNAQLVRRVVSDLEGTYGKSATAPPSLFRGAIADRTGFWAKIAAVAGVCIVLVTAGWTVYSIGRHSQDNDLQEISGPVSTTLKDNPVQPAGSSEAEVLNKQQNDPERAVVQQEPVRKIIREKIVMQDEGSTRNDPPIPPSMNEPEQEKGRLVTVSVGDTIAELAADYYGRVDAGILQSIRAANPDLANIDLIYEGQEIFMPAVQTVPRVLYSVSVASYHSVAEAKAVFLDLLNKGYQATIYPYLDTQGNTWYRITIGTFDSRSDAIGYAVELKDKGFFYAKPVKISMED
ncbi:MAG: AAA family ATPase [Deltaproteobacteria bacterium]|nr:AAA family ATPase [Deltaproteobacteria bacterium]